MTTNNENPYFQMADTWTKGTTDRRHLTNADLRRVLNEPIDEPDPPMQPGDGLVWVAILLISAAVAVAVTCAAYHWLFA